MLLFNIFINLLFALFVALALTIFGHRHPDLLSMLALPISTIISILIVVGISKIVRIKRERDIMENGAIISQPIRVGSETIIFRKKNIK